MVLPLIIIASWILILSVIVGLCMSARQGDLQQSEQASAAESAASMALQVIQLRRVQKARGECLHHALDGGVDRLGAGVQHQVGLGGRLVGGVDTGHPRDLPRAGAGVEPLGIALFTDLQRGVDEHLDEVQIVS